MPWGDISMPAWQGTASDHSCETRSELCAWVDCECMEDLCCRTLSTMLSCSKPVGVTCKIYSRCPSQASDEKATSSGVTIGLDVDSLGSYGYASWSVRHLHTMLPRREQLSVSRTAEMPSARDP